MKKDSMAQDMNKLAEYANENPTPAKPDMNSPEWTPYVLSFLNDNEKYSQDGKDALPKVEGLKRVLQKLVGPIVDMQVTLGQCYAVYREGRHVGYHSTVAVRIGVRFDENDVRYFSGVADKNPNNQGQDFNKHSAACAETAAEGRAYKKALNLYGVLTAEEIMGSNQGISLDSPEEPINDSQIAAMNSVGKRTNVDLIKYISERSREKGVKFISVSNMPRSFASELIKELNSYQQKLDTIPEHLIGFKASWKPRNED